MQVLVTGANGLLGSNLCRELLNDGQRVRALVRSTSNVKGLEGLDVELVHGDVRDKESLRGACEGVDLLYHGAAVFSYAGYDRDEMFATARQGSVNTVDAAHDAGVKRMVLTSTCAILGGSRAKTSLNESANAELSGYPDYFKTKLLQEQTTFERGRELGFETTAANPSIFVGPYDFKPSASMATIHSYITAPLTLTYGGGATMVHAADIARGHIIVAEKGAPFERHVLSNEQLEWPKIHAVMSELCGLPPPRIKAGRVSAYLSAAVMELGAKLTGGVPPATRELAKQVGSFFWYDDTKARGLGYSPRSTKDVLTDTIGWLLGSELITERARNRLKPTAEVRAATSRYWQS